MNPEYLEAIFTFGAVIVSFISLFISIRNHKKTEAAMISADKANKAGTYYVTWPGSNASLYRENDIAELEQGIHPHGKLSVAEIRRIHYFFEMLNRTYGIFHNIKNGENEDEFSQSMMNNICNITYPHREFILTHVLSRGYSISFQNFIEGKWNEIESRGHWPNGILPMV